MKLKPISTSPGARARALSLTLCLCLLSSLAARREAFAQSKADIERERNRGMVMLKLAKDYLKDNYYDPSFHGMDVEARFRAAEGKLKEASSLGQVLGIIAQTLVELDDSHTYFIPPPRPVEVDYGWKMQMIGEHCFVVVVKTDSDAAAQGLQPGDEVLTLDGFKPSRRNAWKMEYNYNLLRPQPGKRVVVRTPAGQERELALKAKVEKEPRQVNFEQLINELNDEREDEKRLPRYYELGEGAEGVLVWKLRRFGLSESKVDDMMKKARARAGLVLDLRGNGGGYETTLKRLLGYFFDREVTVGELKRRKESKLLKVKSRGDKVFKGRLVVLVDSESGSASELFARVIQMEKRGTVVGDRSAGAVMRARAYPGLLGDVSSGNMVFYGVSVTDADIIMGDGKSLEHVGVTPDELLLPTPTDLAARLDPVLARAVELAGGQLSPEKAGTLFPLEKEK